MHGWALGLALLLVAAPAVAEETVVDFAIADLAKWSRDEGVTLDKAEGGALLALPKWSEGRDHWPKVGLTGDWDWSGQTRLVLELHNPNDRQIMASVDLRGVGQAIGGHSLLKPHQDGKVVVDLAKVGGLDVSAVDSLVVYRTQPPFDQKMLLKRIYVEALPTDARPQRQRLQEAADRAEALAGELAAASPPEAKRALFAGQLPIVQAEVAALREALADFGARVRGKLRETARQAEATASRATALKLALGKNLVLWTDTPWRQARATDMPPGDAPDVAEISFGVAGNEIEDRVLNLTNVSGRTLTVTVRATGAGPLAGALEYYAPTAIIGRDGAPLMDALVPLDQAHTLTIPHAETRQLWLRVNTRHADLPVGDHSLTLRLLPLEAPSLAREVALRVKRRPFALPERSPLAVLVWDEVYHSRSRKVMGEEYDEALRMMVEAGVNVFDILPEDWPKPKLNAQGELTEPLDFTVHDQRIEFYCRRGQGQALFLGSPDLALWSNLAPGTDAWRKGLSSWLGAWREHLTQLGLTEKDFAFYLADEPNEERTEALYLGYGAELKRVWPEARIYFNGSYLPSDPEKRKQLFAVADIVQPELFGGIGEDPEWLPALQREVREPWFYSCSGGLSGAVNVYDYYLLQAWKATAWGLKGIGFWSFCAGFGGDPWEGTDPKSDGLTVVYPGARGLIASRRWAAYEEGIEGAKLCALAAATGAEGQALVKEAAAAIVAAPHDPTVLAAWREKLAAFLSGRK